MLAGFAERDIGPLLHDEAETPLAGGKVSEVAVGVERQVRPALLLELGKASKGDPGPVLKPTPIPPAFRLLELMGVYPFLFEDRSPIDGQMAQHIFVGKPA